jgi:cyclophilin family peptidyl-prolyl cis-trans isomerase
MILRSIVCSVISLAILLVTTVAAAQSNPVVVIETSLGNITVELYQDEAPISVENFLTYVRDDFYTGTIFHRVIKGFMVQGGGMTEDMVRKATNPPIKNEATNGLRNARGTLAMARTAAVDSATAQFFINVANNRALNHESETQAEYGYAVFGKVIDGMDYVGEIENTPTTTAGPYRDVPSTPVIIKSIQFKAN